MRKLPAMACRRQAPGWSSKDRNLPMERISSVFPDVMRADDTNDSGQPPMENARQQSALASAGRKYGRPITMDNLRRRRRVVLLRPLKLAVRNSAIVRGAAGDEAAVEATMVDCSSTGI